MPSIPPKHRAGAHKKPAQSPTDVAVRVPTPKRHDPRPSARQRGYDTAWEKARAGYLQHHPLCVHCLAEGIVTLATVVDHITPHEGDMTLFWAVDTNWQALCRRCHSKKTAAEDGGFGNKRRER